MVEIADSSYLNFLAWRYNDAQTVPEAFGFDSGHLYGLDADITLNIALVIDRASDPAALLALDWGDRQKALADLNADGTLWDLYGGRQDHYDAVSNGLIARGINVEPSSSGYVSSAESRTLWVSLSPQEFFDLTGQRLHWVGGTADDPWAVYWNGNLNLPDAWGDLVKGLWVDTFTVPSQSGTGTGVTLEQGPQSPGNATALDYEAVSYYANTIADLYNFPLSGDTTLSLGLLGLVEPAVGAALPADASASFQALMDQFRLGAGFSSGGSVFQVGNSGLWADVWDRAGERSLDVGVAGVINPGADMALYSGPGLANQSNFTGYQGAIWDTANNPAVLSSSWTDEMSTAPGSPFYAAYRELFVDAALRGITMFNDASDGGSGAQIGNGLTNVWQNNTSPYVVVVGGSSLSTPVSAGADATLADFVSSARALDRSTLAALVAGGLKTLPSDAADLSVFMETVWNQYVLSGAHLDPGYATNETTGGGVDITQGVPSYQQAFGLNPQGLGASTGTGRGAPDVSALAGGNMFYNLPSDTMETFEQGGYGTSAATPLWASLGLQINAILADQGMPYSLGYMTDLLYNAAVIAPGAFNDVRVGNNTSTFVYGGDIHMPDGNGGTDHITPLGIGYSAGPGYDLVSGLGTPNGVLLARALSALTHAQVWSDAAALAGVDGLGGLVSGAEQALLLQPVLSGSGSYAVTVGLQTYSASGVSAAPEAWSRQFAQQVLQVDFDPGLVTLFDGLSQARPQEAMAGLGASLSASIGGMGTTAPQSTLSLDYGFVDLVSASGTSAVELARPVAIAANAGGLDDAEAVVRVRQSGASDGLSLTFYKVDDLGGIIGGVRPGEAGYAALAQERAYEMSGGGTALHGPGFGQYTQSALLDVDQGDIIAMILTNAPTGGTAHTYYAFAAANETVDGQQVAHLWNYGLNTWGWEDLYGGGDLDYNDLVVQLDFTSAAGSGVLI
ncbi:MAG: hypothetical protein H2042_14175 [Rhizobiales bacterium]|nr:hypothetical protein [Hyphomicrobiales bacterium]